MNHYHYRSLAADLLPKAKTSTGIFEPRWLVLCNVCASKLPEWVKDAQTWVKPCDVCGRKP